MPDAIFHFDLSESACAIETKLRDLDQLEKRKCLKVAARLLQRPRSLGTMIARAALRDDMDLLTDSELNRLAAALQDMIRPVLAQSASDDGDADDVGSILDVFRKPGIVDPAANVVRNDEPEDKTHDLGLISLGPNPFSEPGDLQHVCIFAAGIHGPGTAHALKALSTASVWSPERPLGGVIEVTIKAEQDWPTRFDDARWKWLTPEYHAEELRDSVAHTFEAGTDLAGRFSPACLSYLRALTEATSRSSRSLPRLPANGGTDVAVRRSRSS
jgi:hypothetical protein